MVYKAKQLPVLANLTPESTALRLASLNTILEPHQQSLQVYQLCRWGYRCCNQLVRDCHMVLMGNQHQWGRPIQTAKKKCISDRS